MPNHFFSCLVAQVHSIKIYPLGTSLAPKTSMEWYVTLMCCDEFAFTLNILACHLCTVFRLVKMEQFAGAKGFNQNLCPWGPRIVVDSTLQNLYVAGMFLSSACTNSSDPIVGGNIPVPSLCRNCNDR